MKRRPLNFGMVCWMRVRRRQDQLLGYLVWLEDRAQVFIDLRGGVIEVASRGF